MLLLSPKEIIMRQLAFVLSFCISLVAQVDLSASRTRTQGLSTDAIRDLQGRLAG